MIWVGGGGKLCVNYANDFCGSDVANFSVEKKLLWVLIFN